MSKGTSKWTPREALECAGLKSRRLGFWPGTESLWEELELPWVVAAKGMTPLPVVSPRPLTHT